MNDPIRESSAVSRKKSPVTRAIDCVRNLYSALRYRNSEWFSIVDTAGTVTGTAPREICHNGSCLLHAVVHLHLFNDRGELFLQKRSIRKKIQPGKWDTSVGGHISRGETPLAALYRESNEEIGLLHFTPRFLYTYIWKCKIEHELVYSYTAVHNGELSPVNDEVDGGRFFCADEIEKLIGNGMVTPNFESEYLLLREKGLILSTG
ncbi:MAG: NUDIX hydrolase [Spirochaetota bacterium]